MSSNTALSLPPTIERLYKAVEDGKPKKIEELYRVVYWESAPGPMTTREMQQHIGWAVTNLNRRIRKPLKKILKPAELKGRYVLTGL